MKRPNRVYLAACVMTASLFLSGCETYVTDINELTDKNEEKAGYVVVNRSGEAEEKLEQLAKADRDRALGINDEEEKEVKEEQKVDSDEKEKVEVKENDSKESEDKKETEDTKKEDEKKEEASDKTEDKQEDNEEEDKKEEEKPEDDFDESQFDEGFYASAYPDVVAAYGTSRESLLKHYKDYGRKEGRCANAEEFAKINEQNQPQQQE